MKRRWHLSWMSAGTLCSGLLVPATWTAGHAAELAQQSLQDARELASIAPPAPRGTSLGLYGDAPLARSHARRSAPPAQDLAAPLGIAACPRAARREASVPCVRGPRHLGFRRFYVDAPSYATAPQIRRTPEAGPTSLLAPATAAIYSANVVVFGNPPGE